MEQLIYSSIPVNDFKNYCDKFFHACGYSTSLISLNSIVISSSGIHQNDEAANIVVNINSDDDSGLEYIKDYANEIVLLKKETGLWEAASPIIIDDVHIGWLSLYNFILKIDNLEEESNNIKVIDPGIIHSVLDLLLFMLCTFKKAAAYTRVEDSGLSVLDSNLIPIIILCENKIEYINGTAVEILGGNDVQNIVGRSLYDFFHPEYLNRMEKDSSLLKGEVKIIRLDGVLRDIELTSGKIFFKGKTAVQILIRDITQRKYVEKQWMQSEVWNRALLNAVPDMMFKFSISGIILDYLPCKNKSYAETGKKMLGLSIYDIFPENEANLVSDKINECTKQQQLVIFEYSLEENEICEGRMVVCGMDEVLLIVRDISDWKSAENQLRDSVKEKEMLLMELHHRVKNNLQIVSSLINQQSRYIDDEVSQRAFVETKHRVHSMALIHEKMYQSRDFVHIDFPDYLKMMVHNLFQSYQLSSKIHPQFEIEPLLVGIDVAIPCGLIVNELVTNCLKYAFPGAEEGIVTLGIKNFPDDIVEISVKDNGKGLPSDFSMETMSSLGLTLVNVLTEQLDGELILDQEEGTAWRIRFNKSQ